MAPKKKANVKVDVAGRTIGRIKHHGSANERTGVEIRYGVGSIEMTAYMSVVSSCGKFPLHSFPFDTEHPASVAG